MVAPSRRKTAGRKRMSRLNVLALAAACLFGAVASAPMAATPAETAPVQPFWVEQVASGLNVPWSMVWLPNGDMLILEKFGGLRIVRGGQLDPKPIPGDPQAHKAGPKR